MGWFSNTNSTQRQSNFLSIGSFAYNVEEKKELLKAHNNEAIDAINDLRRLKHQTEAPTTPELTKQAQDLGKKLSESINKVQIYINQLEHLQTETDLELMAAEIMKLNFHVPRIKREVRASTKDMANSCTEGSRRIGAEKLTLRGAHNVFMREVNHTISEVRQALPD